MPRYFEIVLPDGRVEVMTVADMADPPAIPDPEIEDGTPPEMAAEAMAAVERRRMEAMAAVIERREGLPAECLAKWRATGKAEASFREIDRADIPASRTFRAAWAAGMVVDMDKARTIHMSRIRAARDAAMAPLDVEFTKALGKKDSAAADAAEAKRQALRDLPATFDLTKAATPEALAALWPAELDGGR